MIKKLLLCVALTAVAGTLAACGGGSKAEEPQAKASYEQISPEAAKEIMDKGSDYVIVDVRRQDEYDSGHIAGAILLPSETIKEQAEEVLTDKDRIILVYCRSGNRSKQSAQILADLGYTKVKEFGGIINWPYDNIEK